MPPTAVSAALYEAFTCPFGRDVVVITSPAGKIVKGSVAVCVSAGELESITLKVSMTAEAGAVGVPVIAPVAPFKVKPAGRVPEVRLQVYGDFPPLAASVPEYATPICPFGKLCVVMVIPDDVAVTVSERVTDADSGVALESVAVNDKDKFATLCVGVPEITPVALFSERPAGRVPDVRDHL